MIFEWKYSSRAGLVLVEELGEVENVVAGMSRWDFMKKIPNIIKEKDRAAGNKRGSEGEAGVTRLASRVLWQRG